MEEQQNLLWSQKITAPETGHNSLLPTHSPRLEHWKTKPRSSSWHEQHSTHSGELPMCVPCAVVAATEQHSSCSIRQQNQALQRAPLTRNLLQSQTLGDPSRAVPTATALICWSGCPHCSNSLGFSKIMVLLHCALQESTVIKGL